MLDKVTERDNTCRALVQILAQCAACPRHQVVVKSAFMLIDDAEQASYSPRSAPPLALFHPSKIA